MKKTDKKAKAGKKAAPVVREFVQVQHDFTDSEKLEMSKQHVGCIQRCDVLREQVKSTTADLKAKIKTEEGRAAELVNKLSSGFEMVTKEVRIEFDRKAGLKKLYVHAPGTPHDGEFVRDEAMTQADYERLPLDDAPKMPKPEKNKPLSKKQLKAAAGDVKDALDKNVVTGEGGSDTKSAD